MSALLTCYRLKTNEHVIKSKFFLIFKSTIFGIFRFTHKKEEVWPDGIHPILFAESGYVCMPSFRPVAPFFFLEKVPFLAFLKYIKGCGQIDTLKTFPCF